MEVMLHFGNIDDALLNFSLLNFPITIVYKFVIYSVAELLHVHNLCCCNPAALLTSFVELNLLVD